MSASGAAPQSKALIAEDVFPHLGKVPKAGSVLLRAGPAADALKRLELLDNSVNADLYDRLTSIEREWITLEKTPPGSARGEIEQAIRSATLPSGITLDEAFGTNVPLPILVDRVRTLYAEQGSRETETLLRLGDKVANLEAGLGAMMFITAKIWESFNTLAPEVTAGPAEQAEFLEFKQAAGRIFSPVQPTIENALSDVDQIETAAKDAIEEQASAGALTLPATPAGDQKPSTQWFDAFNELVKTTIDTGAFINDLEPDWKAASNFKASTGRGQIMRLAEHTRLNASVKALLYAIADGNNFPDTVREDGKTYRFLVGNADRQRFLDTTKNAILLAYRIEWGKTPTEDDQNNYLAGNGKVWLNSFREVKGLSAWVKRVEAVDTVDVE